MDRPPPDEGAIPLPGETGVDRKLFVSSTAIDLIRAWFDGPQLIPDGQGIAADLRKSGPCCTFLNTADQLTLYGKQVSLAKFRNRAATRNPRQGKWSHADAFARPSQGIEL
jgi:hypothetical protein